MAKGKKTWRRAHARRRRKNCGWLRGSALELTNVRDELLDLGRRDLLLVRLHLFLLGVVEYAVGNRLLHLGVLHVGLHVGFGVILHVEFLSRLGVALAIGAMTLGAEVLPIFGRGRGVADGGGERKAQAGGENFDGGLHRKAWLMDCCALGLCWKTPSAAP